ncbi:MAG TPA: FtsX-like permease family protein [Kofleriaceae bacterium]|nr:FtsX-like permease family protein [Kofleriaceae bacterium]
MSALRRHRTTAALIILEIALTCAIVCNAVFLIHSRLARIGLSSGLAEDELIRVQLTGSDKLADPKETARRDLAALAALPGVRSAASVNMLPFSSATWWSDGSVERDDPATKFSAAMYMGSENLLETLGVQLVAGRGFTHDEYVDYESMLDDELPARAVIITRSAAERLLPGKNPLGQRLYVSGKTPKTVVGVIDRLATSNEGIAMTEPSYAMIFPIHAPKIAGHLYVLRVDPARRAAVLGAIDAAIAGVDPNRSVSSRQPYREIRDEFFRGDRALALLLTGVSIALLAVTGFGIVGLASFWVQQRTRQIGIRRALGATRGDIVRYFQLENFVLATAGIALGVALAFAINLWLMRHYPIARLPLAFVPVSAGLLWLLGQLAVLGPALRAAAIPPAIATRSV